MGKRPPEHVEEPRPVPLKGGELVRGMDEARLLRRLLAESLRRLRAARQLETTRKIVYPETTCIVRDCERLGRRLNEFARGQREAATVVDSGGKVVGSVTYADPGDQVPEFVDDLEID